MAARKMRGCRESRDISVETYANATESTSLLLSNQSKQQSSRANSEETSFANSNHIANSSPEKITAGATACSSPDQINFISGNPFVEVTKGILHLFKEE